MFYPCHKKNKNKNNKKKNKNYIKKFNKKKKNNNKNPSPKSIRKESARRLKFDTYTTHGLLDECRGRVSE